MMDMRDGDRWDAHHEKQASKARALMGVRQMDRMASDWLSKRGVKARLNPLPSKGKR